jgi:SAM-dependent methyltransferase
MLANTVIAEPRSPGTLVAAYAERAGTQRPDAGPRAHGALLVKLNLGCGSNPLAGFVNVDKFGNPDERVDLERFPWPWDTSSAEEVAMVHVLEHLGATPEQFIGVMKELYRVCKPGAQISIVVPHPRHDHFLGDPTHVRAITPEVLSLFSKANCRRWAAQGAANSPLAVYHDVDLELVSATVVIEPRYRAMLDAGEIDGEEMRVILDERNNVASEFQIVLKAVKEQAVK